MKKITIESLDSLFDYLNEPDSVFWIRDKSYKKQIYLGSAIEGIWGIPAARFYDDPYGEIVKATLIPDEGRDKWLVLDNMKSAIANKENNISSEVTKSTDVLLRIKTAHGEEKYLLDNNYLLVDERGEHLGFAGLVQTLTKEEWFARYYVDKSPNLNNSKDAFKKHIFDLLYKEAGIATRVDNNLNNVTKIPRYYIVQNAKEIDFTPRESECIYHLQQGKTAKQTAEIIHVSVRTVEYHLGNACEKAHVRTKIELLARILRKS